MRNVFEVAGVSFAYDSVEILHNVSFTIEKGTLTGIVGPNGSGKSTLVSLMDRVLKPAIGTVFLDGRDLSAFGRRELARILASVPQKSSPGFAFTVEQAVAMGRFPHDSGAEGDRRAVERALRLLGLEDMRRRPITALSGGELQRVILARAMAQQPRYLLLDEPTAHLDLGFQTEVMDLLRGLAGEGLTVVCVLHDLNLASLYCDRLILMRQGRIFAAGTPAEVLTAENIRRVYGAEVQVDLHPVLRRPRISLLPGHHRPKGIIAGPNA